MNIMYIISLLKKFAIYTFAFADHAVYPAHFSPDLRKSQDGVWRGFGKRTVDPTCRSPGDAKAPFIAQQLNSTQLDVELS